MNKGLDILEGVSGDESNSYVKWINGPRKHILKTADDYPPPTPAAVIEGSCEQTYPRRDHLPFHANCFKSPSSRAAWLVIDAIGRVSSCNQGGGRTFPRL